MNPWYVFDTSSVDLVGLDAVVLKNYLLLHIKSLANDRNSLKHLLRDFYIITLFTQLKNTTNIMMTMACKYLL